MIGIDATLLALQHFDILEERVVDALSQKVIQFQVVEPIVARKGPEIVGRRSGLGRNAIDHRVSDALAAVAFGRTRTGRRHADVKPNMGRRLEADNLPAIYLLGRLVEATRLGL